MSSRAIVTLADSNYFDLLIELIDSIKKHDKSSDISICVLDAGLNPKQNQIIKNKVYTIKKAQWDIEVPKFKIAGKEWLKSQISRAFLPNYFPEFEKYLWIDCDAWVNSWEAIELLFKACEGGKLGITQSVGSGYRVLSRVKWLFGKLALIKSQNYKHAKNLVLLRALQEKLLFRPTLILVFFH